jgi:hypothetical protein
MAAPRGGAGAMVGLTCPHCGEYIDLGFNVATAASAMGKSTSEAKAQAARENGMKGGRPPKKAKAAGHPRYNPHKGR